MVHDKRGTGKSYSAKKLVLDNFFKSEEKEQFVIVRRFESDVKQRIMQNYFEDMQDYLRENYHSKIKFYQGKFYIKDIDEEDGGIKGARPCGYAMAINLTERYKSQSFPNVTTIVFEEMMSMNNRYLQNEISLFNNFCSTIIRKRTNVKVFMLSNAISRYNPYTNELGIDLSKIEIDSITKLEKYPNEDRYKYVIERTKNVKVENNADYYYQFQDNSKSGNMLSDGDFETKQYPLSRKGITIDDCQPISNGTLIYLKYGLDYFMLYKGYEKITKTIMVEKEEDDDEQLIYDFYDYMDDEPEYEYKTITVNGEEIIAWLQTEEPNDMIKKSFNVIILNTIEEVNNARCYAVMPEDNDGLMSILNTVLFHLQNNWLIYENNFTGDSVENALRQLLA